MASSLSNLPQLGDDTFTVELEKLMNNEIYEMCWSDSMDLLAIITHEDILEVIFYDIFNL
jgi:hypothetical protein